MNDIFLKYCFSVGSVSCLRAKPATRNIHIITTSKVRPYVLNGCDCPHPESNIIDYKNIRYMSSSSSSGSGGSKDGRGGKNPWCCPKCGNPCSTIEGELRKTSISLAWFKTETHKGIETVSQFYVPKYSKLISIFCWPCLVLRRLIQNGCCVNKKLIMKYP